MKVILAQHAGFCMGVRRAVETTLKLVDLRQGPIATYGPLIHNPQVLEMLEEKGVKVLEEVPADTTGTVVIRAHGVPPERKHRLEASGVVVEDATCPRVVKVQAIIDKYQKEGYTTVIVGDRDHAEVEGLMGHAGAAGLVVSRLTDLDELQLAPPYIVVSQTTQDEELFREITDEILKRFPGGKVFNTICDSTHKRQDEVREMCREIDALVVVGGRNSANTKRLAEIAHGLNCPVFLVETEDELEPDKLKKFHCVGVTAGASTPAWIIRQVVAALESIPG
ncbi:4-hydroxy-3-methylbut-2-enyl diphosphate reductase [Desulfurivibrio alkaliphilus]|uniref:4-hydroxy-3-methylbut-2-enyl diphosphate reductase n=1 Tax=Desulfurivibrio alkaliphilus (strain DSM 19089 / UNIQEM U267 / AHT2) TaxID=589865 RepID=D6Z2I3_DESAT|nr:4-hydroxy-3-methylbut-2-enyl diphosphate reductase [Desulfurivibrio alkaliphilus]ADH85758.1 hydroxymethylbutenyl pyrophosphate reductase [Desulfurivibrio alkaliphilus AHT 2]